MLPESPLIVCCLTDSFRGVFKRGKDTEPKTTIARKKCGILLQRMDCARCILKQRGFSPAFVFPGYLFLPKYSSLYSTRFSFVCLLEIIPFPGVFFSTILSLIILIFQLLFLDRTFVIFPDNSSLFSPFHLLHSGSYQCHDRIRRL